MDYYSLWLEVMQIWYIVLAVIGGTGLFIAGIGSMIEEEPKYFARAVLVVGTLALSAPIWPLAAPLLLAGSLAWSLSASEFEIPTRLPRKERKRIRNELALAQADKILDDILRENELKRHTGVER